MTAHDALQNVIVALCEPRDVVNIAGTVRAMMNTGLRRLRLIAPADYDAYRIEGIAHGADVVLDHVEFFDTLEAAVADAAYVVGTTARRRTAKFVWGEPRDTAPEILARAADGPVVVVFGREDKGLSNEELDLCDRLLRIPTDPERPSLNLAQAVLLVCYEVWIEAGASELRGTPRERRRSQPASAAELRDTFDELEKALAAIDFFKTRNPPAIMRTVRAVLRRAEPDRREARLFRAVAYEIQKVLDAGA